MNATSSPQFLSRRVCFLCCLLSFLPTLMGCEKISQMFGSPSNKQAFVKIKSIPIKIAFAVGSATLDVLVQEISGMGIDAKDLLKQIVTEQDIGIGLPPGNIATLMLVHKKTNEVRYWKLSNNVKKISLKSRDAGDVTLKVINESPLRIEMWLDSDSKEVEVTVEMK